MKIVMMGSGGFGGYFGARLAAGGADVHFVARGAHLEAMRTNGLTIEGAGAASPLKSAGDRTIPHRSAQPISCWLP